jgi:hypothetical protein
MVFCRSRPVFALAVVGAMGLTACSGDGSTPTPTPTPTPNVAPVFTSAPTANIAENSIGTIYTAAATDANGNPLTFALAGGSDQSLFAITAGGALSFVSSPDFESPKDNGANNVYEVVIRVSDGITSTDLALAITVTDVADQDMRAVLANDWSVPLVQIVPSPVSVNGVYVVYSAAPPPIESLVFYADRVAGIFSNASGLHGPAATLSFTPSPVIATSGKVYMLAPGTNEVRLVTNYASIAGCYCNRDVAQPWDTPVLLRIPVAVPANVTAWIGFGPDGYLYIAIGDGVTDAAAATSTALDPNSLLGKILRIDLSRDDFPADPDRNYGIPAGNPYAAGGGAPEVWALGVHRPSAVRFESTGELFFTDSGASTEEVNLLPANTPGMNYGWPQRDGTAVLVAGNAAGLTPPVAAYSHGTGPMQGNAILAGGVYTGPIGSIANRYVFTNAGATMLWSIPRANLVLGSTVTSAGFTGHAVAPLPKITRIGFDRANTLYLTTTVGAGDRLFAMLPNP